MPKLVMAFLILLGFHVSYSTQCDCNPSCAIYVSPVQCVRCCTHYVKRSLPLHPAHHRKRQFLMESSQDIQLKHRVRRPVWKQEQPPIESSLPRFIRLLLKDRL